MHITVHFWDDLCLFHLFFGFFEWIKVTCLFSGQKTREWSQGGTDFPLRLLQNEIVLGRWRFETKYKSSRPLNAPWTTGHLQQQANLFPHNPRSQILKRGRWKIFKLKHGFNRWIIPSGFSLPFLCCFMCKGHEFVSKKIHQFPLVPLLIFTLYAKSGFSGRIKKTSRCHFFKDFDLRITRGHLGRLRRASLMAG